MPTLICVSATREETARLLRDGPRRDFIELADATGGQLVYRSAPQRLRGNLGRLFGPHVWQAWQVAARVRDGDVVYADAEHVGVPLLLFLALRRRRPRRVVFIGDTLWLWKRVLLWFVTRLGIPGRLIAHSAVQARLIASWLPASWDLLLLPYQVDTEFWQPKGEPEREEQPLLLAVGSEYRDYETLVRAVDGLPLRVVIAAGSHWAREASTASTLPANVELLTTALPFAELRELYERAAIVAVPVQEIANQTGVTAIFEAMSMARPVIVTATRGQRECVRGPLVRAGGSLDRAATAARGPQLFDATADDPDAPADALYVPVGDAGALRAAISLLLEDPSRATEMGGAGRASVRRHFTVEQFASRFAAAMLDETPRAAAVVAPRWDS